MRNVLWTLAALALAAPAVAQDIGNAAITNASPSPSADRDAPTFDKADRNGDGAIDRREAASSKTLVKEFAGLDKDRDGRLDKGEFARLETEQMRRPDGPDQEPQRDPAR